MNVCELMSLFYEACLCSAVACACMAAESQHSQRGNSNLDFHGKSWLNVIREGVSCRCFCPDPFIHRKTEARTYKQFEAMDGSLKANSSESCLVKNRRNTYTFASTFSKRFHLQDGTAHQIFIEEVLFEWVKRIAEFQYAI